MVSICPSCFSQDVLRVDQRQFQSGLGMDMLPETFRMQKCNRCGLYYKEDLPSSERLRQYYESISEHFWDHELYPHERRIAKILNGLPKGSRILDVGCGTALLLGMFTQQHECFGIEGNEKAARIATSKGVTIIDSWITSKLREFGKFDVIFMLDVFEHLTEPSQVLKDIYSCLAADGQLIIVTGRTDCFPYKLMGPQYWYFKLAQHLVFLNRDYIRWLSAELENSTIAAHAICHYEFDPIAFLKGVRPLIGWTLFSSWSRLRIFTWKRYNREFPFFIIKGFKDHYFIQIRRKS